MKRTCGMSSNNDRKDILHQSEPLMIENSAILCTKMPGTTAEQEKGEISRVEHDYHDHANDGVETMTTREMLLFTPMGMSNLFPNQRLNGQPPFPVKLHAVLEEVENDPILSSVIAWQPHGRCFIVHKITDFVERILKSRFRQSKFASFQRQLNLYGFKRLTSGRDRGGYYHELFLRNKRFLCNRIHRLKNKGTGVRKPSSPETEPSFYNMPFLPQGACGNGNGNTGAIRSGSCLAPPTSSSTALVGSKGYVHGESKRNDYRIDTAVACPLVKTVSFHKLSPNPLLLPMSLTMAKLPMMKSTSTSTTMDETATVVTTGSCSAASSTVSLPQMMGSIGSPFQHWQKIPIGGAAVRSSPTKGGGTSTMDVNACHMNFSGVGPPNPSSRPLPYFPMDETRWTRPLQSTMIGHFMEPTPTTIVANTDSNAAGNCSGTGSSWTILAETNATHPRPQEDEEGQVVGLDDVLESLYDAMAQPLNSTTAIPPGKPNERFGGNPGPAAADAFTGSNAQMVGPAAAPCPDFKGNNSDTTSAMASSKASVQNTVNEDQFDDFDNFVFFSL